MLDVRIDEEALRIQAQGHAGIMMDGADLGCAAASMLLHALAAWAREKQVPLRCMLPGGSAGRGWVMLEPGEEQKQAAQTALACIGAGYRLLAQAYPEQVRVTEEKPAE